jgi:hypothetical protein
VDSQPAELSALAGPQQGLKQLGLARALGLGLLVVALWMATRPYQGIFHDTRFYTAEVLRTLLPDQFSYDLYFQYGSQGRFTIFSFLYRPLISFLGVSGGNIALTIMAQSLWLGGLAYLSRVLFRDWKLVGLAMAATILLPSGSMFHYGEPFVTPRPFAEALTFWALGSQLKGRPVRALGLLSVSVLVHPLMTLPGLAVWFLYQAARWRVLWLFAAVAIVAVFALAFAGIQPFSWLFVRFDSAWLEILRTREDFCFVGLWRLDRWLSIGGSLALGLFEFTLATPSERRVLVPIFAVGAGGILLSFLGGDLLHNVLLFDIQTWRSMWLFTLVANLFALQMFLRFVDTRPTTSSVTAGLIGLGLGLLAISSSFDALMMGSVLLAMLAIFVGCWEWIAKKPASGLVRIPLALLFGGALTVIFIGARIETGWIDLDPTLFWGALCRLALSICIAAVIWFFPFRSEKTALGRLHPVAFSGLVFCFVAIACWQWDQRSDWNKFVYTSDPPSSLTNLLPSKDPIYWEGDVAMSWFLLKRASYFSCDQGTGALFSRDTAIAYGARYKEFERLQTLDFRQYSFCPLGGARRTAPLQRAELSRLCTREQGLGALVLTQRVADAPYRIWISPAPFKAIERSSDGAMNSFLADHFYIYTCADLR